MKRFISSALAALSITTAFAAQDANMTTQTASFIPMTAAQSKNDALASFLSGAAPLVKQTEPGTLLWFALRGQDDTLAIFDIFADSAARDAHFAGTVAGALNKHAAELVSGGWDDGVVANVRASNVLSTKEAVDLYTATTATYISLKAAPGQGAALEALLRAAGPIVAQTEPKTLYWAALKINDEQFAIFDIFADESGRAKHFAGQVAGLLNQKSAELVEGGWEAGVVANVRNFEILAIK